MIVGGADPGFDGAIAFIDAEAHRVVGIVDVPTATKRSGRREVLLHELVADCLGALDGRRCGHLYLEKVNAFAPGGRRMGASSAFSLGECFMAIRMLAACNGWPVTLVGPAQWKRVFSLGPDKSQSRLRASELLPDDAHWWTPQRRGVTMQQANGRAESVLLAVYGLRSLRSIEHGKEKAGMAETSNSAVGPTGATTYHALQGEQEALRQRTPGFAATAALKPGEVPRIEGYAWNVDGHNVQPTLAGDDDDG